MTKLRDRAPPSSPWASVGMTQPMVDTGEGAQGLLDALALSTMPVPVVGDVAGLASDAYRFATDPESRTLGNAAWASLGMLPFVPYMGAIRAYHGSPHGFDAFDMSKIGSGEGSQAYGHGLYFSEDPAVARSYQAMAYSPARRQAGLTKAGADQATMYTVDLDVEPEDLLEWEALLSQQSEKVRDAVEPMAREVATPTAYHLDRGIAPTPVDEMTGEQLYKALARRNPAAASSSLRYAGIPGIKYTGEFRRTEGKGTRNFVLFDEALARILERNGQPVAGK